MRCFVPRHIYSLHLKTGFQLTHDGAQFEIHIDLQKLESQGDGQKECNDDHR